MVTILYHTHRGLKSLGCDCIVPLQLYSSCDRSANEDVQKIFDLDYADRKDHIKHEMAELVDRYKHKEGDTGAIEVQGKGSLVCKLKKKIISHVG